MIPKKIHFCWYGGGEYTNVVKKCIASWDSQLPDYQIKKWDESNTPFDKLPFLQLLHKHKKWAFIADYMRLYALYTEGGIYLDTDIEIVKNFDKLLGENSFIGFQTDLSTKYPLNNAVIGSVRNSPFILDCLKAAERKQRLHFNAMAGPQIVTDVLYRYGLDSYKKQHLKNVLLLPAEYFYPFTWSEMFNEGYITKNTICIHWWEGSWSSKNRDMAYFMDSIKRKMEKLPLVFLDRVRFAISRDKFYHIDKDI